MSKKCKPESPFPGRWRITWMNEWDQEFVDEEGEGFFEFRKNGVGTFHFGFVHGEIDSREGTRNDKPCVEFTWVGNDEMEAAQGRGWAIIDGDEITGEIFFHHGEESEFKAKRDS